MDMKAPKRLTITNGRIRMIDRSSTSKYLAAWQKIHKVPNRTDVCVIRQDALQEMYNEIQYLRTMFASLAS